MCKGCEKILRCLTEKGDKCYKDPQWDNPLKDFQDTPDSGLYPNITWIDNTSTGSPIINRDGATSWKLSDCSINDKLAFTNGDHNIYYDGNGNIRVEEIKES